VAGSAASLPRDGTVVVFDLEWTAWEGSHENGWSAPGEEMEIVQIGAVRLNGADRLAETAQFSALVRPRINPALSAYFTGLTGITQAMVDADGVSFPEALDRFAGFIGGDTVAVLSFGKDPNVLQRNCRLCDVPFPFDAALFVNVVPALRAALALGDTPFSSSDLPRLTGFAPPGTAHDAMGDARCIAGALRVLRARGRL